MLTHTECPLLLQHVTHHLHTHTHRRSSGWMIMLVAGSHLGETVLGEHVKQRGLPALAVPHHHYLTLHTRTGIHAGYQR